MRQRFDLLRETRKFEEAVGLSIDWETFKTLQQIGSLIRKHKRACENYCNGVSDDTAILKIEKVIEAKIATINAKISGKNPLMVEFQNDPRGLTAKLYHNETFKPEYYYLLGLTW